MLDVLCCKITIGDADPSNPIKINNPIVIQEVESIEINDSYKKLIGTAIVTFPKGSVFQSTVIGNATIEGADASKITTEIMEDGVVIEKRSSQQAMNETSFSVGQRINIKLGYNGVLKNVFDGYISAYNSDSKFVLKCENMAYKLKLKQAPKFETSTTCSVNDILGEKYELLKDTGFEVHSETKRFEIQIGKIKITDNFTVADILNEWTKYKLYCFLKYDENSPDSMPTIAIGRPYSSSKSQPTFPKDNEAKPYQIHFDYHVADNGLEVLKTDPKFLAVTGKALGSDGKFFEATIRLNPESNGDEFQTINATQISKKSREL